MGKINKAPRTRRDAADAARLQAKGQHGDTVLAHINPQEARLLDYLADRKIDAPRNPKTGLLSFGMSDGEGPSGNDSNPGGVGGGPAGGNTGGGIGGNTAGGLGGEGGGYNGSTVNGYGGYADLGGYISGLTERAYNPLSDPSIESLLNTPNGFRAPGYEGLSLHQYSPPDTFGRLLDTYLYGPPPSYTALGQVPGRYGAPTGRGPGIAESVVSNFGGPMMSAMMGLGMHMDQAMSPATRAASLSANQAQGAKNSTGSDPRTGLTLAELRQSTPGARSNAETVAAPVAPPGYTVNPAGQIVPQGGGKDRPAHQDAIKNLLYDYIWRGPSGRGWA
jgi:hypothetical protein